MRLLPVITVVSVLAVGCSSSSPPRAAQPSTTSRPDATGSTAPATRPASSPEADAVALVSRMLDDAVLPAGARRTEITLTTLQQGPWEVPAGEHVVTRNRAWLVPAAPDAVLAFLGAHPPMGYVARGRGSVSGPGQAVRFVTDERSPLPPDTAEAGLEIGVVGRGDGSLVNVVAGAQWTPVRPAAEFVDARDHTVVIRVLYPYRRGTPTIRRAVVTGAAADDLARTFNALRVAPVGAVHGCPALTRRSLGFELRFAESNIVAARGPCGGVDVTVHGKRALGLTPSPDFDDAIARALGVPELHFVR
jgi:hypothetical protein